ncbi:hypothetical protein [Halomonas sp. E19]|uniref:hypothetical protein n=1 Tax=Halomonas sp. E19 TaxID=3397247 RepID=UPI004034DBD0
MSESLFHYLLLLNPTDIFRIVNLTFFEAARTQSGLASIGADAAFPRPCCWQRCWPGWRRRWGWRCGASAIVRSEPTARLRGGILC